MKQTKLNILSTRPLKEQLVKQAAEFNINIDCKSFIETTPVLNKYIKNQILSIADKNIIAVFTSMNAVEAVSKMITGITPPWDVYCLGNTTKELVKKNLKCNIIADATDATSLAIKIITDAPGEVWFFCGDRRRDELPEKLLTNSIQVQEVIVYKTAAVHHIINSQFDGVLFYSPSAVESFFSVNKVGSSTVLFAIGKTTASAIENFSANKIIISSKPGKEEMVHQMLDYFRQQTVEK